MLEDYTDFLGVVKRNRKLQISALVWSLVIDFTTGENRFLVEFRRSYNSTADDTLCPSDFYQRAASRGENRRGDDAPSITLSGPFKIDEFYVPARLKALVRGQEPRH